MSRRNGRSPRAQGPRNRWDQRASAHAAYRRSLAECRSRRNVASLARRCLTPGTIVEALVDFEDRSDFKRRPVIILGPTTSTHVAVLPCTSQRRAQDAAWTMREWEAAGLVTPTFVKIWHPRWIRRSDLITVRGQCSTNDWEALKAALPPSCDATVLDQLEGSSGQLD